VRTYKEGRLKSEHGFLCTAPKNVDGLGERGVEWPRDEFFQEGDGLIRTKPREGQEEKPKRETEPLHFACGGRAGKMWGQRPWRTEQTTVPKNTEFVERGKNPIGFASKLTKRPAPSEGVAQHEWSRGPKNIGPKKQVEDSKRLTLEYGGGTR